MDKSDIRYNLEWNIIYGKGFGPRFELFRLFFPWLSRVDLEECGPETGCDFICCVKCKVKPPQNEYLNFARGLTYLTRYTLTFDHEQNSDYEGNLVYFRMKKGLPWREPQPGENVYLGEDVPTEPYRGGSL